MFQSQHLEFTEHPETQSSWRCSLHIYSLKQYSLLAVRTYKQSLPMAGVA